MNIPCTSAIGYAAFDDRVELALLFDDRDEITVTYTWPQIRALVHLLETSSTSPTPSVLHELPHVGWGFSVTAHETAIGTITGTVVARIPATEYSDMIACLHLFIGVQEDE